MILDFPHTERWLNGAEYEHLIKNFKTYELTKGYQVLKDHPNSIYTCPTHGMLYFLQGYTLKNLGFPRVKGLRKRFKWKKMNFVTPLPKQKPKVHYLVATGRLNSFCYRMHIVYLDKKSPLLCHMMKIQNTFRPGESIPSRQHFKENAPPVKEPPKVETKPIELPQKLPRSFHPLEQQALWYKFSLFKRFFAEA